jgi:hypothetical protein
MQISDNPYSSTNSSHGANVEGSVLPQRQRIDLLSFSEVARSIFLGWEQLRIVYLIILSVATMLFLLPTGAISFRTLRLLLEGVVVANVLYFAGPLLETYLRWLGFKARGMRSFLFFCGTVLSLVLALATLGSELPFEWIPDQK